MCAGALRRYENMYKLKHIFYNCLPYIPEFLFVSACVLSLVVSFSAYKKASRNERAIVSLQSDVSELVRTTVALQQELSSQVSAIDAHIQIIEKYAAANYNFFYGDGVKQKIKGNPVVEDVDPNGVLKHKSNLSKSKK